ncbi:MAG: histidine phosphatase family protein [Patescibacteria group bacterium]|nr:histidine phosphatase family protein [Patescibacteria group bacterium]
MIRHGESEGNIIGTGNMDHSPLSDNGRKQAEFLAKRCKGLSIKSVITSPLERSKETGRIIASSLGITVESSDLFAERRKPSAVFGQVIESPDQQKIWRSVWDNFHIPGFRHSDEENFEDLKDRAQKALQYLASRPEETVLVVTHGIFLRVLAALVVIGPELDGRECRRFMSVMEIENTGLSVFKYDSEERFSRFWMLSTWNDRAHLGE